MSLLKSRGVPGRESLTSLRMQRLIREGGRPAPVLEPTIELALREVISVTDDLRWAEPLFEAECFTTLQKAVAKFNQARERVLADHLTREDRHHCPLCWHTTAEELREILTLEISAVLSMEAERTAYRLLAKTKNWSSVETCLAEICETLNGTLRTLRKTARVCRFCFQKTSVSLGLDGVCLTLRSEVKDGMFFNPEICFTATETVFPAGQIDAPPIDETRGTVRVSITEKGEWRPVPEGVSVIAAHASTLGKEKQEMLGIPPKLFLVPPQNPNSGEIVALVSNYGEVSIRRDQRADQHILPIPDAPTETIRPARRRKTVKDKWPVVVEAQTELPLVPESKPPAQETSPTRRDDGMKRVGKDEALAFCSVGAKNWRRSWSGKRYS